MKYLRLLIVSLSVGVLLTTIGYASAVTAQQDPQKESTTQTSEASKTAPIGFPTGSKCTKTGTYKAENKYIKIVIVVAEGEEFPLFADGEKTIWYALAPSTKSTLDAIKVTTEDPK